MSRQKLKYETLLLINRWRIGQKNTGQKTLMIL